MRTTYNITAEVGELMGACEAVFSRIIIEGELTALDKEILEYYSKELQKHLHRSGDLQDITDRSKDFVPSLRPIYLHNFDCM